MSSFEFLLHVTRDNLIVLQRHDQILIFLDKYRIGYDLLSFWKILFAIFKRVFMRSGVDPLSTK